MKFIVDTQLPHKLATYLRKEGYDCIHTTHFKDGHLLGDEEIIKIAIDSDRSVISKDADFLDNYHLKGAPPKVLYLTFGNISNNNLLSYFADHLESIIEHFGKGSEFIEFNQRGLFVRD